MGELKTRDDEASQALAALKAEAAEKERLLKVEEAIKADKIKADAELERSQQELAKKETEAAPAVEAARHEAAEKEKALESEVETKLTAKNAAEVALGPAKNAYETAKEQFEAAKDTLDNVLDMVGNIFKGRPDKAIRNARDAVKSAAGSLSSAENAFNRLKGDLDNAVNLLDAARKTLTDHRTYKALRDKTWSEVEKRSGQFGTFIRDFGTDIEKAFLPLVNRLEDTFKEVNRLGGDVLNAGKDVVEQTRKINVAQDFKNARDQIRDTAKVVVEETKRGVKKVAHAIEEAAKDLRDALKALIDKDIILYRADTDLVFSVNCYTGGYYTMADLGFGGLKWDTEKSKALFEGNFSLPDINPIAAAAGTLGDGYSMQDEYESQRTKYIASHKSSYYASKRFVDWGGPETAARLIAYSIFDSGNTAQQEIKSQLMLEYDELLSWLQLKGEIEAQAATGEILAAVLGGGGVTLPTISAEIFSIPYTYSLDIVGSIPLPKLVVDKIRQQFEKHVGAKTAIRESVPHVAYAVQWKSAMASDRLDQLVGRFDSLKMSGKQVAAANAGKVLKAVASRINNKDIKNAIETLSTADFQQSHMSDALQRKIESKLGLSRNELTKWYVSGQRIIRLENTPVSTKVSDFFGELAFGNRGEGRVADLQFDLETFTLSGRVELHHEHSWGSIRELIKKL